MFSSEIEIVHQEKFERFLLRTFFLGVSLVDVLTQEIHTTYVTKVLEVWPKSEFSSRLSLGYVLGYVQVYVLKRSRNITALSSTIYRSYPQAIEQHTNTT